MLILCLYVLLGLGYAVVVLMACFWFDCLVVYFVLYIGFVGGWFPVYFV